MSGVQLYFHRQNFHTIMTNAQSSIRQRLFWPGMNGNLLICWFGEGISSLTEERYLHKEGKAVVGQWEVSFQLVGTCKWYQILPTTANSKTNNDNKHDGTQDSERCVSHVHRSQYELLSYMCIQRSREATTPLSKIHKKGKGFTAIILQFSMNISWEEGEKERNRYFWKYSKNRFRVKGEKESNDYGQGSKK